MPQGQAGGIGSTSSSARKDYYQDPVERMRGKYFDDRQDVSRDRLERRLAQQQEYDLFKLTQMKPVSGASNLYQSITPGGPTLADKAKELAMKYGPTPSEIAGDITYGLGNIARGFGDFVGKGGVVGNLLSGIYDKFKSGTQQGIETVKDLYDNLRQNLSGKPDYTINRGGGSVISSVTEEPMYGNVSNRGMNIPVSIAQPVAYSPTTPVNTGFIPEGYSYGIGSVPINNSGYYPDAYTGIGTVSNVPDYYDPNNTLGNIYLNSQGYDVPVSNDLMSNRRPSYLEQQDNYYYQNKPKSSPTGQQYYYAENNLPISVTDLYNIIRKPELNTSYGNLRLDNVLSGEPTLGFSNTVDIFGQPVDLNASIGNQRANIGATFQFKDGGSVDKYAGLGYKLR